MPKKPDYLTDEDWIKWCREHSVDPDDDIVTRLRRRQPPINPDAEIERLARLPPLEYERQSKDAARRLGVKVSALNKAVAAKRREFPPPPEVEALLAELNADNCVVIIGQKTMVLRFEDMPIEAHGVRTVYRVPTFLRFDDFRNFHLNKYTVDDNGAPFAVGKGGEPLHLGHWWLDHPGRLTYQGVIFTPNAPKVIDERLNLWTGFAVTPKQGDWPLMREHIRAVLAAGDASVYAYIINWLAWTVQHPGKQAEAAPVFIGGEGTGKGLLGRAVCRIFGPRHSCHISSPNDLTGRFNDHLQQCCFLFADEAYAPQDHKAESELKRLITEDTIRIEPKNIGRYTVPNPLHVMMASNREWVVPAGVRARRYMVVEIAETHQQNKAYFSRIFAELDNGGLEAMFFDLLAHDLGGFHPRDIVRTKALAKQQEQSLDPKDEWWLHLLQTGVLAGARVYPNEAASNAYEEEIEEATGGGFYGNGKRTRTVKREGLFDQARRVSPKLKNVSEAALGRYLRDPERGCVNVWVKRERGWRFPPLAKCRDRWCERFPETVWPDDGLADWTLGEDE
jgi:hypothetical protein